MKRLQRTSLITTGLMALVGTAFAQGTQVAAVSTPNTERVQTSGIPPECDQFRTVASDSRSATLPWEQRLSLAACRQNLVLQPITSGDQIPAMLSQIDQAMQPSIAIYQDAITRGPTPDIQILAAYGLGMTHLDSMVRARSAIEYGDAANGGPALTAFMQTHDELEPQLVAHRDAAVQAFEQVTQLAEQNPNAARANPVMAYVVGDAANESHMLSPGAQQQQQPQSQELPTPGTEPQG